MGLGGLGVRSEDSAIDAQIAGQGVNVSFASALGVGAPGSCQGGVAVSHVGSKNSRSGVESRGGNRRPLRGPPSTTYHWKGEVMERA